MKDELVLKIIIIGSTSVGKSTLVNYFLTHKYDQYLQQTTGVEYSSKNLIKEG